MIYILFLSPFFIFSIVEIAKLKKSNERMILIFLVCIIIFFIGPRYKTGLDWLSYLHYFNSVLDTKVSDFEYGYRILNVTFRRLFDSYFILQFAVTCFFVIASYRFVKKYSSFPIISLYLLVVFFTFNVLMSIVRQSLAMGIILYSTKYIINRKPFKFLLTILIASMFHVSAVLTIPLYILNRNIGKAFPIFCIVIALYLSIKHDLLFIVIRLLIPFFPERLSLITSKYISTPRHISSWSHTHLYLSMEILLFILLLFKRPRNLHAHFFINVTFVSIILKILGTNMVIMGRVEIYYSIFSIITYTYLFTIVTRKERYVVYFIYFCIILMFFSMPYIKKCIPNGYNSSNRLELDNYIPYYNAIFYHPKTADKRR
jgi:hypothetical protein